MREGGTRYLYHAWAVAKRLREGRLTALLLYMVLKTIMKKKIDPVPARGAPWLDLQPPVDGDHLIELLSYMCPGQDAQIRFRTNDHRDLSGYWLWDIVNLQHKHVARKEVRSMYRGKALREYHRIIFRRIWRWKDAMKKLQELQES